MNPPKFRPFSVVSGKVDLSPIETSGSSFSLRSAKYEVEPKSYHLDHKNALENIYGRVNARLKGRNDGNALSSADLQKGDKETV